MIWTEKRTIQTPRLLLRPFVPEDAPDVLREWLCDPLVAQNMLWHPATHVDEACEKVFLWMRSHESYPPAYQWAIVPLEVGHVCGRISLADFEERHDKATVVYELGRAWWGKGYMPEALRGVLLFGFHEMGLHRIQADHFVSNPASGRVMLKAGMHLEGILRGRYLGKRGYEDCALYAALRADLESEEVSNG